MRATMASPPTPAIGREAVERYGGPASARPTGHGNGKDVRRSAVTAHMDKDPIADALRAIEAGTPVDWDALESDETDEAVHLATRDLKILSGISTFHRALQESASPLSSSEAAPDPAVTGCGRWGPLSP